MKLLLINDTGDAVPEEFLTAWVRDLTRALQTRKVLSADLAKRELSVVFLKEPDAKNLNWNYRQKDYATDVLSFETDDPDSLGELVMCMEVLRKQANQHKVTVDQEIGNMVLHGVLHLLGYDHEKSEDEHRRMMTLQDQVFEELLALRRPLPKARAVKASGAKKPAAKKKAPARSAAKKVAKKKSSVKKTKRKS